MTSLTASDFPTYFQDVHGYKPFPWQTRLTEQVLKTGSWPKVIDLPTGSGKTAVLDTAIFSLACQPESFPRRVIFVIDRRIIVDQVYERADKIQAKIAEAGTPVLRQVRDRIGYITGSDASTQGERNLLGVSMLKGGIPIDSEWSQRPDLPWVVVSTVDQFGSRLLFRGYGVSPKMRPVHAGLAGNDCLVILDEVHLSRPFAETLASVEADHFGEALPQRKFHIVEMSATPSDNQAIPFRLEPSDLDLSPTLRQRVKARKIAFLKEAGVAKQTADEAIPKAIETMLKKNELPVKAKSVGIIVNRVRTAREIHESLVESGAESYLVTGRMRPLDREKVIERIQHLVDPDRNSNVETEGTTFVVATQAIEVGADFSFDALITECAPVDSLKQRFGRLDRRGTFESRTDSPAKAFILGVKSDLNSKIPDPIYGQTARATWVELHKRLGERSFLEIGSQSDDLKGFPEETKAPSQEAPLLLPTCLNAWAQTNPEPIVQPEITHFLHGKNSSDNSDVTLIWRWDHSKETLRIVPPRPAEYLQVPINAVKKWLDSDASDEFPVSDAEPFDVVDEKTKKTRASKAHPEKRPKPNWVRWEGLEDGPVQLESVREIRPGNILLVTPNSGGISYGNWNPESAEPVDDLGDFSQLAYERQVTLRLDDRIYPSAPHPPSEESEIPIEELIREWLEEQRQANSSISKSTSKLLANGYKTHLSSQGESYFILQGSYDKSSKKTIAVDYSTFDGSDETFSCTGSGTTLRDHMNGLGELVATFAERLYLSTELQQDMRLAGQLHDLGKVDLRFQRQLVGDDPILLAALEEPLAKSLPNAPKIWRYPKGMRHEMASVALINSNPSVLESAHDPDLVLHLIATHHGLTRPIPKIVEDPEPQELRYSHNGHDMKTMSDLENTPIAVEAADRFWRLAKKYGHHGLAWLEAIFRLADHRQSAREVG